MKTLRNLRIVGGLKLGGTGVPAAVGDQVKMYLDTEANAAFPEHINGIIQHPITQVDCSSAYSYNIEYAEADLAGSVTYLRPQDVVDTVIITQGDLIYAALVVETAARVAADALKAPLASPTFTGTVTIPAIVAPIVGITGTKAQFNVALTDGDFGFLSSNNAWSGNNAFDGTTNVSALYANSIVNFTDAALTFGGDQSFVYGIGVAAIHRTALGLGTLATQSGTFSGTSSGTNSGDNSANTLYSGLAASKADLASPTFTGTLTLSDAVNVAVGSTTGTTVGTAITQKLAFHGAAPVIQRASAAQVVTVSTVGAAVVTTASTLSAYGFTQAQADSIVARVNSLIVDGIARNVLLNEIRAALVEKGIIKGAA